MLDTNRLTGVIRESVTYSNVKLTHRRHVQPLQRARQVVRDAQWGLPAPSGAAAIIQWACYTERAVRLH